jgi:hypothetical protein
MLDQNGEVLPNSAIKELTSSADAEIFIEGETPYEIYKMALDRFNQAYVAEAIKFL